MTLNYMAEQTSPLRKIVYDIVEEIIDMKRDSVVPCMAHINEIRNSLNVELLETLRSLCRDGIIGVSTDVNKNPMFFIKYPL